jgi:hypothetical protein
LADERNQNEESMLKWVYADRKLISALWYFMAATFLFEDAKHHLIPIPPP